MSKFIKKYYLDIIAWLALLCWLIGLYKRAHAEQYGSYFVVMGIGLSVAFFIPLFFFFSSSKLENHYRYKWIRSLQGVSFMFLGLLPLFRLQYWPGQAILFFGSFAGLTFLALSMFWVKSPRIGKPVVFGLLVVVLLSSPLVEITRSLKNVGKDEQLNNYYSKLFEESNRFKQSLSSTLNDSLNNQSIQWQRAIKVLEEYQTKCLEESLDIKREEAISILGQGEIPQHMGTDRVSNEVLVGRDMQNPLDTSYEFSAMNLKFLLQPLTDNVILNYPKEMQNSILFSYHGYKFDTLYPWESVNFGRISAARVFLKLENYKLLAHTEQYIAVLKSKNGATDLSMKLHRDRITQLLVNERLVLNRELRETNNRYYAFMNMTITCLALVIFIFFIPNLPLSKTWKMRGMLFVLVLIFELLLLLIDYFVGIFTPNPAMFLLVNVFLALGLVTLDNFLRNNFLKWYEEE